ncbi:hypothetical protein NDN08_003185 [Rhodosorus marinus]|uniref:G domain-containing protein n=1 Tax=Rhodosorus marinus TaxID=101924 RepID=A0AAV8UVS4_9RHOD|nr:hypothetical protein NDN08_003185 [Rhodosorus marinus]
MFGLFNCRSEMDARLCFVVDVGRLVVGRGDARSIRRIGNCSPWRCGGRAPILKRAAVVNGSDEPAAEVPKNEDDAEEADVIEKSTGVDAVDSRADAPETEVVDARDHVDEDAEERLSAEVDQTGPDTATIASAESEDAPTPEASDQGAGEDLSDELEEIENRGDEDAEDASGDSGEGTQSRPPEKTKQVKEPVKTPQGSYIIVSGPKGYWGRVCSGCGAVVGQVEGSSKREAKMKSGSMKELRLKWQKLSRTADITRKALCDRCRLLERGDIRAALRALDDVDPLVFKNQLRLLKGRQVMVLKVIDALDFDGSWVGSLRDLIGGNPIVLAVTKMDLVVDPDDAVGRNRLMAWINRRVAMKGIRPVASFAVSGKLGLGVDDLAEYALETLNGRNLYVVGYANSGKSTLVNQLKAAFATRAYFVGPRGYGRKKDLERATATVSRLPGTTLKSIRIPCFKSHKHAMWDTPGIIVPRYRFDGLEDARIKMISEEPTRLEPKIFKMYPEDLIVVGDNYLQIEITPEPGRRRAGPVEMKWYSPLCTDVELLNRDEALARIPRERPDDVDNKVIPRLTKEFVPSVSVRGGVDADIVIQNLGFMALWSRNQDFAVRIFVPRGCNPTVRPSMPIPDYSRLPPPAQRDADDYSVEVAGGWRDVSSRTDKNKERKEIELKRMRDAEEKARGEDDGEFDPSDREKDDDGDDDDFEDGDDDDDEFVGGRGKSLRMDDIFSDRESSISKFSFEDEDRRPPRGQSRGAPAEGRAARTNRAYRPSEKGGRGVRPTESAGPYSRSKESIQEDDLDDFGFDMDFDVEAVNTRSGGKGDRNPSGVRGEPPRRRQPSKAFLDDEDDDDDDDDDFFGFGEERNRARGRNGEPEAKRGESKSSSSSFKPSNDDFEEEDELFDFETGGRELMSLDEDEEDLGEEAIVFDKDEYEKRTKPPPPRGEFAKRRASGDEYVDDKGNEDDLSGSFDTTPIELKGKSRGPANKTDQQSLEDMIFGESGSLDGIAPRKSHDLEDEDDDPDFFWDDRKGKGSPRADFDGPDDVVKSQDDFFWKQPRASNEKNTRSGGRASSRGQGSRSEDLDWFSDIEGDVEGRGTRGMGERRQDGMGTRRIRSGDFFDGSRSSTNRRKGNKSNPESQDRQRGSRSTDRDDFFNFDDDLFDTTDERPNPSDSGSRRKGKRDSSNPRRGPSPDRDDDFWSSGKGPESRRPQGRRSGGSNKFSDDRGRSSGRREEEPNYSFDIEDESDFWGNKGSFASDSRYRSGDRERNRKGQAEPRSRNSGRQPPDDDLDSFLEDLDLIPKKESSPQNQRRDQRGRRSIGGSSKGSTRGDSKRDRISGVDDETDFWLTKTQSNRRDASDRGGPRPTDGGDDDDWFLNDSFTPPDSKIGKKQPESKESDDFIDSFFG